MHAHHSLIRVDSLLPSINLSSEKVHSEEVRFVPCGQKQGPSLNAQSGRHKQQTLLSKNGYPSQEAKDGYGCFGQECHDSVHMSQCERIITKLGGWLCATSTDYNLAFHSKSAQEAPSTSPFTLVAVVQT